MNKIVKSSIYLLTLVFLNVSMVPAKAGIFKCVSMSGKTYFVDKPCPVDNKETELQAVKDPTNGYIPPDFVLDANNDKKSGVVVGASSKEATEEKNDVNEDDKATLGSNGSNQSNGRDDVAGETTTKSDSDVASERTESDIIFNRNLKKNSKTSNRLPNDERLNVTILEPSGK